MAWRAAAEVAAGLGEGEEAVGLGVVVAAGCGWETAWAAYAQAGGAAGVVAGGVAVAGVVVEVVAAAVAAAAQQGGVGAAEGAEAGIAPSRKGVEVWGAAPSAAVAGRAASAWR